MNFLADENIDGPIVKLLRTAGHKVLYVAEIDPAIDDDQILTRANQEGSLLVTGDKDFGELVFRQKRISTGVILVRLEGLSPKKKADIVADAIGKHAQELRNSFTVISPGNIRIRAKIHE